MIVNARLEQDRKTVEAMLGLLQTPEMKKRVERALLADGEDDGDTFISAVEAGRILGRCARSVHVYAAEGLIRRSRMPGVRRARGFSRRDVIALRDRSLMAEG